MDPTSRGDRLRDWDFDQIGKAQTQLHGLQSLKGRVSRVMRSDTSNSRLTAYPLHWCHVCAMFDAKVILDLVIWWYFGNFRVFLTGWGPQQSLVSQHTLGRVGSRILCEHSQFAEPQIYDLPCMFALCCTSKLITSAFNRKLRTLYIRLYWKDAEDGAGPSTSGCQVQQQSSTFWVSSTAFPSFEICLIENSKATCECQTRQSCFFLSGPPGQHHDRPTCHLPLRSCNGETEAQSSDLVCEVPRIQNHTKTLRLYEIRNHLNRWKNQ